MKLKNLFFITLIALISTINTSAKTFLIEYKEMKPSNYMLTKDDSLLINIESKIEQAFIQSMMSGHLEALENMIDRLETLNQTQNNHLIHYWIAYGLNRKSICYLKKGETKKSSQATDLSLKSMDYITQKNSEDHALYAYLLSFAIQFNGGLKAMTISKKIDQHAQRALALNSTNLRAYYVLGSSDFYTPEKYGGGKKAVDYLQKAVACKVQTVESPYLPSWGKAEAYDLLVQALIKEEKVEEAKKVLQQALKEYPNDYQLGQLAKQFI